MKKHPASEEDIKDILEVHGATDYISAMGQYFRTWLINNKGVKTERMILEAMQNKALQAEFNIILGYVDSLKETVDITFITNQKNNFANSIYNGLIFYCAANKVSTEDEINIAVYNSLLNKWKLDILDNVRELDKEVDPLKLANDKGAIPANIAIYQKNVPFIIAYYKCGGNLNFQDVQGFAPIHRLLLYIHEGTHDINLLDMWVKAKLPTDAVIEGDKTITDLLDKIESASGAKKIIIGDMRKILDNKSSIPIEEKKIDVEEVVEVKWHKDKLDLSKDSTIYNALYKYFSENNSKVIKGQTQSFKYKFFDVMNEKYTDEMFVKDFVNKEEVEKMLSYIAEIDDKEISYDHLLIAIYEAGYKVEAFDKDKSSISPSIASTVLETESLKLVGEGEDEGDGAG